MRRDIANDGIYVALDGMEAPAQEETDESPAPGLGNHCHHASPTFGAPECQRLFGWVYNASIGNTGFRV